MRRSWLVWLWLWLGLAGSAQTLLDQLLQQQRVSYPAAVVTSGFSDPRGVSRYRSQPGLHLGYDIAMAYGSEVRAAWGGRVVSIVPWADGEWGVCVEHPDGTTATYGHVQPRVRPGQLVKPGQPLATIASDHLDVKMRDRQGVHFDYAGRAGWGSTGGGSAGGVLTGGVSASLLAQAEQLRSQLRSALSRPLEQPRLEDWKVLEREGLVSGPPPPEAPDIRGLVRRYRALPAGVGEWGAGDRQQARHWQEQSQALGYRYELGLVSRRHYQEARSRAEAWAQLLREP